MRNLFLLHLLCVTRCAHQSSPFRLSQIGAVGAAVGAAVGGAVHGLEKASQALRHFLRNLRLLHLHFVALRSHFASALVLVHVQSE